MEVISKKEQINLDNLFLGLESTVYRVAKFQDIISPGILAAVTNMNKLHEAILPSFIKSIENMAKLQDTISPGLVKSITQMTMLQESVSLGLAGAADQMAKMNEIISPGLISGIAQFSKIQDAISPSIAKLVTSAMQFENTNLTLGLASAINRLNDIALNLNSEEITINNDGTISVSEKIFEIKEVQELIENSIEKSVNIQCPASLATTLNNLLDNAVKQHPLLAKIVIFILLPILINIFTSQFFSDSIKSYE